MFAHLIGAVGAVLILIAQIWVAIAAFQRGILWGLAVLCIPFVAFIFIILNWSQTKQAVIFYVIGSLMTGWASYRTNQFDQLRHGRFPTSEA